VTRQDGIGAAATMVAMLTLSAVVGMAIGYGLAPARAEIDVIGTTTSSTSTTAEVGLIPPVSIVRGGE
jgi:hypothetical protein